jgi:Malectin domain
VGCGVAALLAGVLPGYAGVHQDRVVSSNPEDWTPVVVDGKGVFGSATVGATTVAAGSFTTVRERGAAGAVTRNNIFAFDSSGRISTTFRPNIPGRIWDVIPAGDGQSVFVGGAFTNVNGLARTSRVARIDVNTGQVMTTFRSPGINGKVTDLHLANGRLYVGGYFGVVGGQPQTALVALNPQTGANTGSLDLTFADVFRDSATPILPSGNSGVGVEHLTMTPDGSKLVAVGNFRTVEGQSRVQVAMVDTSSDTATLSDWSTDRYSMTCHQNFPTYTTAVDASPDGSYFAITTGGAFNGGVSSGTLCDTVARWEFAGSGPGQQPTWVDYVGGDTATAVHITGGAVYIGGHFRWVNNPFVGDAAGPGTVHRPGLAALDPRNGLPFSWNPGKLPLNYGVLGFSSTSQGLWINHDGDRLNGETTGRLGLMPLAGAASMPADDTGALPGSTYLLGKRPVPTGPSPVLHRVNAGGPELPAADGYANWAADDVGSALHNTGSNTAAWGEPIARSAGVPVGTPQEIFSTERWDPGSDPAMEWDFPVETGLPLQVRLYFSNGYGGTSSPGQRVFDVDIDGTTVLDDYDIAAEVGHLTGTMKAFDITSDGNVDIDFGHVVENPLINGIEIVRTDIAPPADTDDDRVLRNALSETGATGSTEVGNGGVDWSSVRGAFMVDGRLYTGWADGTFTWRSYNGNFFGGARPIDLHGLTAFSSELTGARGMWFDRNTGRMYYTLAGQNTLYYRYFTPQSRTVGAVRFTAVDTGAGIDWSRVSGGFLANGRLYFSNADGSLSSVQWQDSGPVAGTTTPVSGPTVDGIDWSARALFLHAP